MAPTHPDAAAVHAWCERIGVPALVDVHTHFLPPPVQAKVWAQFDQAGPKIGREWPIRYRESAEERVEALRAFGVRRFTSLPYAHRPGISGFLNDWARDFSREVPDCARSATFFPEEGVAAQVEALVADGVEVFKAHVQVGEFHLDDPLLDDVWPVLQESRTPVVLHAGSGPVGNAHTGPASTARVLERFPGLAFVMAHMGAPEWDGFIGLAERFEHVRLDTAMVFTDFFSPERAEQERLLPRLSALVDKVVFGSDFPTIPYPYVHQLEALECLGLGEDWLRRVCWTNPAELLGVTL